MEDRSARSANGSGREPWLPLGDVVNTAARLQSAAAGGQAEPARVLDLAGP